VCRPQSSSYRAIVINIALHITLSHFFWNQDSFSQIVNSCLHLSLYYCSKRAFRCIFWPGLQF